VRRFFLVCALVAFVPATADAALLTGGNGKIAFVGPSTSSLESRFHVFTVDPDGTDLTDVTPGLSHDANGVEWSPDGTQIAFSTYEFGPKQMAIWVMNADGSDRHKILDVDSFEMSLSWTPDGSRIVFPEDGIYSVKPDGTDMERITPFDGEIYEPMVSPNGTKITFTGITGRREIPHVWVVNMDGSGLRRLTSFISIESAWSPDGSKLATVSERGVETVDPDGGNRKLVIEADPFDSYWGLSWSPDGWRIAFTSLRFDFLQTVRIVNRDGTCPIRLVDHYAERFAWQSIPGGAPSGPAACANLKVQSTADRRYVRTGGTFTVTDIVRNTGSVFAQQTMLDHPLSKGLRIVEAQPSQGSCDGVHRVVCSLGTITPG
jgi:Tol biopolymer transport system component